MVELVATPAPETVEAVEAWIALKDERANTRIGPTSKGRIGSVLNFIGLPCRNAQQFTQRRAGPGTRWAYFTLETDHRDIDSVKGAPQFGSQANGTYHVFCFWEEARPDRLRANTTIRDLARRDQTAVIVLYLDALTEAERQDVRRMSFTEGLTFVVIDEILIGFLARNDGDRLTSFLKATMPYTAANPYNPVTAGFGVGVPPEMFYGRRSLAAGLETLQGGTSLLFGGRQLGKTALLRHVEQSFSQPEIRRFAWFIDLKSETGVGMNDTSESTTRYQIFEILHRNFTASGIIEDGDASRDPGHIRQELIEAFRRDPQLQVLAMFDESDAFLLSDWRAGSIAVESMRDLMGSTGNRFKIVFAGLHNVQRFAQGPNNPFPNLGYDANSPRRGGIGPLDDHEARPLIEEPFDLLGFRFQPLAVDKILSYTNRHPSLIQFFCHELIESFRRRHAHENPPFEIGIDDIDRVYRTQSIQDGIKSRFQATFELEPRYRVIALTMIFYQDHPTQKWTMDEIREHCLSCCPLTFAPDNMDISELESLLNELIGLGILAQDGKHYRLRSSLIAQMFGNMEEIGQSLEDLQDREPFDAAAFRIDE